jgi:U4/U6.U5 tri-snRNP-associated protein 1
VTFKSKKKRKSDRKDRKMRKKAAEDEGEEATLVPLVPAAFKKNRGVVIQSSSSKSSYSSNDDVGGAGSGGDRMSRTQRESRIGSRAAEGLARKDAYAAAVERANARSSKAMGSSGGSGFDGRSRAEVEVEDADTAVADNRPLAVGGAMVTGVDRASGADFVLINLKARAAEAEAEGAMGGGIGMDVDDGVAESKQGHSGQTSGAGGKMVFTAATEFSALMQNRLAAQQESRADAAAAATAAAAGAPVTALSTVQGADALASASGMDVAMDRGGNSGTAAAAGGWAAADAGAGVAHTPVSSFPAAESAAASAAAASAAHNSSPVDVILDNQPLAASGMAATLALLKSSGDFNAAEEDVHGRTKDSRQQNPSERFGDIKLEYRDDFGRLLSQKEAYRQMAYKFHGIKVH